MYASPKAPAVLVAIALASLPGCSSVGDVERARAEAREPGCSRYCLIVEPTSGPPGTLFTFRGYGWRPRMPVEALYGRYNSNTRVGIGTRFRAGPDGRFVFAFRHGPRRLPGDAASGAGPPLFEQWRGRAYKSRLIRRERRYEVTVSDPQP